MGKLIIEQFKTFRSLNYLDEFNSFDEFYGNSKPEIYMSIIEIFEEFQTSKEKVLSLGLNAIIGGREWGTHISLEKEQYFILKRDLLPYFELQEDYETCQRIIKLHNNLVPR
jgi:hypothetical protein